MATATRAPATGTATSTACGEERRRGLSRATALCRASQGLVAPHGRIRATCCARPPPAARREAARRSPAAYTSTHGTRAPAGICRSGCWGMRTQAPLQS